MRCLVRCLPSKTVCGGQHRRCVAWIAHLHIARFLTSTYVGTWQLKRSRCCKLICFAFSFFFKFIAAQVIHDVTSSKKHLKTLQGTCIFFYPISLLFFFFSILMFSNRGRTLYRASVIYARKNASDLGKRRA